MYFTKEDFLKIENYLKTNSKKDTDFTPTDQLRTEDRFVIVQDNENKIVSIKDLYKAFRKESNYKIILLKEDVDFKSQITDSDCKYIVRYNYNLNGETITIPENCFIDFQGGKVTNGTLIGQDTIYYKLGDEDGFGDGIILEGTWRENQGGCEDCVKREEFDELVEEFLELKAKVDRYHPEPTPTEDDAWYGFTTKPTAEDIAAVVDVTASKPTEGREIDGSAFIGPTDYYLVYPLNWERIENDMLVNPVVTDSNGFEMGAYPDPETPTVLVDGIEYRIEYRITYVGLGKGKFTVYFNK